MMHSSAPLCVGSRPVPGGALFTPHDVPARLGINVFTCDSQMRKRVQRRGARLLSKTPHPIPACLTIHPFEEGPPAREHLSSRSLGLQ